VRKRDGREVPFEKDKIAAAVESAQRAVGEEDPLFAREVADLVELALRRRYAWRGLREGAAGEGSSGIFEGLEASAETATDPGDAAPESVPNIEEIQDLVEVGLVELGRAAVAKAYILYRDRRSRARESMSSAASREAAGELRHLRVREAQGTSGWSKGRIVAALVQEADLSRGQAEEVALRVEARVVSSGLKRLTTALIRELVDNELVSMGLSGALLRQAPVSIPRHDLRGRLERGDGDLGEELGGELLRRYALADLFDEATLERHLSGELHLEDLRAPHLHLAQSVPSGLLMRGTPGVQGAFDALDEIAKLFGSVSRGVLVEEPAALLGSIGRSQDGELLRSWLLALVALGRGAGRRVDLAGFGARGLGLAGRCVEELDALTDLEGERHLPRLLLDEKELRGMLAAGEAGLRPRAERLLERGLLVPTWAPTGELCLGPAGRRGRRERGALICGGAAALDLERLARQAGPWREDLLLEGLAHGVEAALAGLDELARFQRRYRSARRGEARGRVAYGLVPVGLREALRLLGDGELRADAGARLLGLAAEAARRFADQRGLSVFLTAHHGDEARRRFAEREAASEREHQGLLFERAAEERSAPLRSAGFDLGSLPGQVPGRALAQLCATVPAGVWRPLDLPASGDATPQLDAFELFLSERSTIRRSVSTATEIPRTAPIFPLDQSSPQAS